MTMTRTEGWFTNNLSFKLSTHAAPRSSSHIQTFALDGMARDYFWFKE